MSVTFWIGDLDIKISIIISWTHLLFNKLYCHDTKRGSIFIQRKHWKL